MKGVEAKSNAQYHIKNTKTGHTRWPVLIDI